MNAALQSPPNIVQGAAHDPHLALADGTLRRLRFFDDFSAAMRVLDVGCGSGVHLKELAARGCQVIGVEPDPHAVDDLRRQGFDVVQGTAEHLPFDDAAFDAVVCSVVVPFTDERFAIAEWSRVLAPQGQVRASYHGLGYALRYLLRGPGVRRRIYGGRTIVNSCFYSITGRRLPGFWGGHALPIGGPPATALSAGVAGAGLRTRSPRNRRTARPVFPSFTQMYLGQSRSPVGDPMRPAIQIHNLGKRYLVDHEARSRRGGYKTLRESFMDLTAYPLRRLRGEGNATREEFWALRDVSFDVQPGEVLGIIGSNGAGKSTLLKILSQVTKPTKGRVELDGRVGSLLEVGTGFHPELTGRENIYLNGSILGMRKAEIDRKFDEIVEFSGTGKFLDTPVKRYSSGMHVRLAFAVAAHLEPEILLVDEVLAVGDSEFQRRCLSRMEDISSNGRTVILVSHNMGSIESLCTHVVELRGGRVESSGKAADVVNNYRRAASSHLRQAADQNQGLTRFLRSAALLDESGRSTTFIPLGGRFQLALEFSPQELCGSFTIGLGIDNLSGQRLLTVMSPDSLDLTRDRRSVVSVSCVIEHFPLAPGEYTLKCAVAEYGCEILSVENALIFSVEDGALPTQKRGFHCGVCVAPSAWHIANNPRPTVCH